MKISTSFKLNQDGTLIFDDSVLQPNPDIRHLKDALAVYLKPEGPPELPLYYMYRGVCLKEHEETFSSGKVRYDITVILPGQVDKEYIKTVGHFHPSRERGGTYPEYYEVLSGEAIYLLQKNSPLGEVEDIEAIEAKQGDKIFIPSEYGHVTINPSHKPLVMANLVEKNFSSLYGPFRDKNGAAYFCVEGKEGKANFIRNPHYHDSVGLRILAAPQHQQPIQITPGIDLYEAFTRRPEEFDFLC